MQAMPAAAQHARVPPATLAAYSLMEAPLQACSSAFALFVGFVYEQAGIAIGVIGLIFLLTRLSDVLTDPLIGWLSDRTPGRLGRRRPWVVAGAPIVVVSVRMLFLPPESPSAWYLAGWLFALWLGWTMIAIPYYAWGAELSPDYGERTRISTARTGFGYAGVWLAVAAPTLEQRLTGSGASPGEVLALVAAGATLAIPLAALALAWRVPETPSVSSEIPVLKGIRVMWSNRPFRRLLAAFTLSSLAPALQGPLYLFFVVHVVKEPTAGPLVLVVFYTAIIPGVLLWAWLANRIEKHRAWMCGMGVMTLATPLYLLLGPGDVVPMMGILVLSGIGAGSFTAVPASMKADVIDLDSLESGEDRAGAFFAAWSLAAKAVVAVGPSAAFAALAWIGFDSKAAEPSPRVLDGLRLFFSGAPMLCYFGALLLVRGYPLTRARHGELRDRLSARAVA